MSYHEKTFSPNRLAVRSFFVSLHRRLVSPLVGGGQKMKKNMAMTITNDDALNALKKALEHKKEAKLKFEQWLQEKGIVGKVVTA